MLDITISEETAGYLTFILSLISIFLMYKILVFTTNDKKSRKLGLILKGMLIGGLFGALPFTTVSILFGNSGESGLGVLLGIAFGVPIGAFIGLFLGVIVFDIHINRAFKNKSN